MYNFWERKHDIVPFCIAAVPKGIKTHQGIIMAAPFSQHQAAATYKLLFPSPLTIIFKKQNKLIKIFKEFDVIVYIYSF